MANRYWVGAGNGVWNTQARWSATSGGSGGATIPTSADNVFFDANSGSGIVSISAAAPCLNMDTTGFAGSFTMTSSYDLTINGTSIKLTVPLTGTSSNSVTFSPAASTTMTIDVNNRITGANVLFSSATGTYLLASNLSGNVFNHSTGTLRLQGFKITASSTYTISNSVSATTDFGATESTIEATTITIGSASVIQNSENASFICNKDGTLVWAGAARTFKSLTINATTVAGTILVNAPGCTFTTGITYNAVAASRLNFPASTSSTITVGHFQINGQTEFCYVGNASGTVGSGRVSATTTTLNNVIFDKFTALGTAPWTGTSVGVLTPALTTGITPTPFTTVTATVSSTTTDWFNASIWDLGRAPLPDDDAIINCTAATATLTNTGGRQLYVGSLAYQSTASTVISSNLGTLPINIRRGGYELKTGISFLSSATSPSLNLEAVFPGTYYIRSALGLNGTACLKVTIPTTSVDGVTYIVDSDFLISGVYNVNYFYHFKGNLELSANCAFFSIPYFESTGTTTRSITLNNATVQITSPSSGWYLVATGLTLSAANATIELITDATPNRSMYMAGGTYGTIKLSGNFGGSNSINGPGTVNTILHTKTTAFTLQLSGAISVENFLIEGTSNAKITLNGPGGTGSLTKTGGGTVTLNHLTVTGSNALPANTWFGGPDTLSGGTNTGWTFNLDRYWVGAGNGTWATPARWATTSGGVGGNPVPTNGFNVIFDANSGSGVVAIATDTCRSINTTGFAGSFTIGTSLSVYGNATITVPMVGTTSKTLVFRGSAEIPSPTINIGNNTSTLEVQFGAANTFLLTNNLGAGLITLSGGAILRTQGFNVVSSGAFSAINAITVDFSTSTITAASFNFYGATVINSSASTLINNGGTFDSYGTKSFGQLIVNASTPGGLTTLATYSSTFAIGITYNALPGSRLNFPASTSETVICGHFEVNGQSEYCFVGSTAVGGGRVSATTSSLTNVIFDKFTALGTAPWTGDTVGVLSATGITKTPFTTVTATVPSTSTDWFDASIWDLGRAPLPDDDAVINCTASTATLTNTGGRQLYVGSLTYQSTASTVISSNLGTLPVNIRRGGYELKTGISFLSSPTSPSLNLEAAFPGTYYIRSAVGLNGTACIKVTIPITSVDGVTYIVDSDFLITGVYNTNYFHHLKGNLELSANCAFFRVPDFQSSGTTPRSITLNTATVQIIGSGNGWYPVETGLTLSAANATIELMSTDTGTRYMYMANGTYGTIKLSGPSNSNYINGPGIVNTISHTKTTAFNIQFNNSLSVENFLISGSPTARITLNGPGGSGRLTKIGGGTVTAEYLTITGSNVLPANTWYGGPNTSNGGTNTGWIFNIDRYWVGTGNGSYSTAARWATTSGGVGGAGIPAVPTSAFNAIFDANSGSGVVTVSSSDASRDFNTTGFAGSFTLSGDFQIAGSAIITVPMTGPAGRALLLQPTVASATATINIGSNASALDVKFNGTTPIFLLEGNLSAVNLTLTNGTLRTQGFNVLLSGAFNTNSGTTVDFSTSTITASSFSFYGATVTNSIASTLIYNGGGSFDPYGAKNFGQLIVNAPTPGGLVTLTTYGSTFAIGITYNAQPGSRLNFPASSSETVTCGHFQVNGQSEYCYVGSTTVGGGRVSATTSSLTNVIFDKFTALGTAPWTGDTVGVLSATGITKTPIATVTATVPASTVDWFNATIWDLGRAPLPDDDAIINCTASTAVLTNTGNRKFYLGSLTYQSTASTVVSSNLGLLLTTIGRGGYELKTGISFLSLATAPSLNLEARFPGTYYIRSALGLNGTACSKVLIPATSVTGATYIVDSDFLISGTTTPNDFFLKKGNLELSANCAFFRVPYFDAAGVLADTRIITLNNATVQLTGTSSVWNLQASQGITLNAGNSTLEIIATDTASKYVYMGGFTYNNIKLSGNFNSITTINGGCICNTILHTKTTAFTLQINGTFTVENFLISGAPGARITFGGTNTLVKTGGGTVTVNYLTISNSTATPANTWYAGIGTFDGNGNTGWVFIMNRYRVGTNTNWSDIAGWSTTSGGPSGASAPTNENDVYLDAFSLANFGGLNISIRSLNTTGYTGTIGFSGNNYIYGDLILTVPAGGSASTNMWMNAPSGNYIIDTRGNPINLEFRIGPSSASSVQYSLASDLNVSLGCTIYKPLHTNGYNITSGSFQVVAGAFLDPSTSTITASGTVNIPTNAGSVVNGENCRFVITGSSIAFNGGNQTFGHLTFNAVAPTSGIQTITGTNTFAIGLTYNAIAGSTLTFNAATQTIGNFVVNGNTDYPLITSSTVCNITASTTDLDLCLFQNINALGTAGWGLEGGVIGGIGNTTGFNFTPPITLTTAGGGDWLTTVVWDAGRPPLPQDEVRIQGAGTAITITNPSARTIYAGSLSLTAASPTTINLNLGTNRFNLCNGGYSVGQNVTVGGTFYVTFKTLKDGIYHLSSLVSGVVAESMTFAPPTGVNATYIVDTNFNANVVYIDGGNFILSEGCSVFSCSTFSAQNLATSKTIDLGKSTLLLSSAVTLGLVTSNPGILTLNAKDSTIIFNQSGAASTSLGTNEFGTIKLTGTSSSYVYFGGTGTPSIKTIISDKPVGYEILIQSGKTVNVENFLIWGRPGLPVRISGNGGTGNLVKTGGGVVSSNYLAITNVTASPANTWYAGPTPNSSGSGTTTGWIFNHAAGFGPTTPLFYAGGF